MYQPWLASILIASAPLVALAQTPATQKPSSSAAVQTPDKKVPPPAAGAAAKPDAKGVRTVEIIGTDDMKFSVQTIAAKPGEQIRVRLMVKGGMPKIAMAHNFVLLAKAADTLKFVNAAALARTTDFIPPEMKAQVLAATTLAGAGETVEVTFKAPTAPGEYTYLCTFPGHFQSMRGTLTVK
jgi:azurin